MPSPLNYHRAMFSYRHAFHAGNHADVLKHSVLVHILSHLIQKPSALQVVDTHAGAGLYDLGGPQAQISGEAHIGIGRLLQTHILPAARVNALLAPYLGALGLDAGRACPLPRRYPGSPLLALRLLRAHDKLHAFELHPTDQRLLRHTLSGHDPHRLAHLHVADGFAGVKALLPPPSRRGLLVCDPSYELKTDYARVVELVGESLKRFATGCILVWHPIVARREAHDLPRRLGLVAQRAGRPWLHATLTVRSGGSSPTGGASGLSGSGVWVANPTHGLAEALQTGLPFLVQHLAQDAHATHTLRQSPA